MRANPLEHLNLHDLPQVVIFRDAYQIITTQYEQAQEDDLFQDRAQMEKVYTAFVERFAQAVADHNSPKIAGAWQELFSTPKLNPLIALLLGANAHVNYDLALALKQAGATSDFLADYTRFLKIVASASGPIITKLRGNLPESKFPPLRFFYKSAIFLIFSLWRFRVWRNFLGVIQGDTSAADLDKESTRFAKRIKRFGLLGVFLTLF